ncbi:hypothetical protein PVAND_001171 [Polypedilum vanderplanki]|uniref:Nucleolar protein 14 n=1 Tax=Polypedilum vanderplanki TaxID=319348 RepID=A0A9J6BNE3_POLVA|nr:hypothetical protein PVAND_001171 [Polypedilum vanderplanki]
MKLKKGNKRNKSDAIYDKKSKVIEKKQNPFELHVNREKFNILNRKRNHSLGQPLISRQKAFEKRKETIGAEYKVRNKTNVFEDKRKSGYKLPKQSIYNLNDSEVLTHRGQSLGEIEQFDDVIPDRDDDISDEEARLDANFTKNAHFGGGDDDDDGAKDRKTIIEELIADSKKRKAERMKEHEEILDLTNKLDTDWKSLLSVMKKMERTEDLEQKKEPDDYDRLVKEMIFSPRGEPTQKLKSEEELARIEREKLEKLENLRLQRMKDADDVTAKNSNYRSADDLDDGYLLEPVVEEEDQVLSYPLESNNEPDNDAASEKSDNDTEVENDEQIAEEEKEEEGSCEESEEEESDVDSLDDLKANDSESENEEEEKQSIATSNGTKSSNVKSTNPQDNIPFTISMPANYEDFLELFNKQSIKNQSTIVERIIKTNHPKLYVLNKMKMQKLFTYLLQYINDLFSNFNETNISKYFKLVQQLIPHLYDLIHMSPEECSENFLDVIKEKYDEYKKNPKLFPRLDTLIFFKIMASLFPTSDFRHPIVTPCYIFLHHILSQAKVKNRYTVAAGLFLVTLTLEFQHISKRFMPSVMNFLTGICFLGSKKSPIEKLKVIPPFKRMDELLVLTEKYENEFEITEKLKSIDFSETPIDDYFKARALNLASCLMKDIIEIYNEHVGMRYLLDPFEHVLNRLSDEKNLPESIKSNIDSILADFKKIHLDKKFKYPEPEKKNIPMLRMLEPRFENVHTDRRQMYCQSGNAERKKLKHMVKRENKAAKRELRRDNEFVSKIRHKRQRMMDIERKEKVKRIFQEANVQQSEFKALSRTKGRKSTF